MALSSQLISSSLILQILELLNRHPLRWNRGEAPLGAQSCRCRESNERADEAAKAASRSPHTRSLKVEVDDLKPSINRLVLDEWQSRWHSEPDCALKRIRPNIGRWESSSRRSRTEEVALTRLRIGHCYATHNHLLTSCQAPVCTHCNAPLTVRHVLSPRDGCVQLRATRRRFFPDASLDDILGNEAMIPITQVLSYLRAIQFNIVYNSSLAQAARLAPSTSV